MRIKGCALADVVCVRECMLERGCVMKSVCLRVRDGSNLADVPLDTIANPPPA